MFAIAGVSVLVVALIVVWPLATIWSANVLLGLGIPYSLKAWCAALWFIWIFGPNGTGGKK